LLDYKRVYQIALWQRRLLQILGVSLFIGVGLIIGLKLALDSPAVLALNLASAAAVLACVYFLGAALGWPQPWVWPVAYAVLAWRLGFFSIFFLLIIVFRASQTLRDAGEKVGMLGISKPALETLRQKAASA
jgi:hypothetical protein